jgi:hypothetical protein
MQRPPKLIAIVASLVIPLFAYPSEASEYLCLPATAVAEVVSTSVGFESNLANRSQTALLKQAALIAGLPNNNRSVGSQLSPEASKAFEEQRRELIAIEAQGKVFSDYVRDVKALAELIDFAKIMNQYDVTDQSMTQSDRNKFAYLVIMALREMQPEPTSGEPMKRSAECTISVALDLAEQFELTQLSKYPTDERTLRSVKDLRRLRTLSVLASKRLELQLSDYGKITWNGDVPTVNESYDKWLSSQPTSFKTVDSKLWPVIRAVMASNKDYELSFKRKRVSEASAEHPVSK